MTTDSKTEAHVSMVEAIVESVNRINDATFIETLYKVVMVKAVREMEEAKKNE